MSIHAKIQKLLALGERAGTEAEAQAAMSAAHRLLAEHNLSMSDIEAHGVETPESLETDESVPTALRNTYWRDATYSAVAKLYFCKVYMKKNRSTNTRLYAIVGKPSNIAVVKYMAAMLVNTVDELSVNTAKEAARIQAEDGIVLNVKAFAASFRIGYATRIAKRVNDEIEAARKGSIKSEAGTALMLAPVYDAATKEIDAFLAGKRFSHARPSVNVRSSSGYGAGQEAGNNANLRSNGVAGGSYKQLA